MLGRGRWSRTPQPPGPCPTPPYDALLPLDDEQRHHEAHDGGAHGGVEYGVAVQPLGRAPREAVRQLEGAGGGRGLEDPEQLRRQLLPEVRQEGHGLEVVREDLEHGADAGERRHPA